jgi:hypothetical protein
VRRGTDPVGPIQWRAVPSPPTVRSARSHRGPSAVFPVHLGVRRPRSLRLLPDERLGYVLCALVAHRDALPARVHTMDGPALQGVSADLTAGWHPDLRRLATAAEPDTVSLQTHRASRLVAAWPTSYVTVIGDALHTMPSVGGLGGNAALRDAHLLCRTLAHRDRRAGRPRRGPTVRGGGVPRDGVRRAAQGGQDPAQRPQRRPARGRRRARLPPHRAADTGTAASNRPVPRSGAAAALECDGWTAHVAGSQLSRPDVA